MSEKKIVWLAAFRWPVPADFEDKMERLAQEGWNVRKVGQWSSLRMEFEKTEPRRYRYVYDINTAPKPDYIATYQDFGWEFVGQMASCFLWRKAYEGERPEIFSDIESRRRRNRNVKNAVMVSFVMFTLAFLIALGALVFCLPGMDAEQIGQAVLGLALSGLFAWYLGWVMRKIMQNVDR